MPNYQKAVIPVPKLRDYALNLQHPSEKNKALVFKSVLGYTQDNYKNLIDQVRTNLPHSKASKKGDHGHGMSYQVDMMIKRPNGKTKRVRTGWIEDKDSKEMRLTSIYVKENKHNDGKTSIDPTLVHELDVVELTDGRQATIVFVPKDPTTGFEADVGTRPEDWDTISITASQVKKIMSHA